MDEWHESYVRLNRDTRKFISMEVNYPDLRADIKAEKSVFSGISSVLNRCLSWAVMVISTKPTCCIMPRSLSTGKAPAAHELQAWASSFMLAGKFPWLTISETDKRPPGFSTR